MAQVFNFNEYQMKRSSEKKLHDDRLVVAVYRSVVFYVHMYIDEDYENPSEHLTTDTDLRRLYKGDRGKFMETMEALRKHWDLIAEEDDFTHRKEFEHLSTIGHLCSYIEKKVKAL
ncbi:hypothetical protein [Halobacillus litoralis]|uniref:Uncharacterized protein n=1 Tax=Halobacillus litoralis TaxID=45668 RepID=A0A410M9B2_9BACI|nr:hypothetical protein [Halobacillus litoralis]QAS51263.1 hypothetical protein HLI_03065 [Halobacillus litoralis]